LPREVLRKRDRHRTSTEFRLGVIRWVHEICKRPLYNCKPWTEFCHQFCSLSAGVLTTFVLANSVDYRFSNGGRWVRVCMVKYISVYAIVDLYQQWINIIGSEVCKIHRERPYKVCVLHFGAHLSACFRCMNALSQFSVACHETLNTENSVHLSETRYWDTNAIVSQEFSAWEQYLQSEIGFPLKLTLSVLKTKCLMYYRLLCPPPNIFII
jgi:hypothetical protein